MSAVVWTNHSPILLYNYPGGSEVSSRDKTRSQVEFNRPYTIEDEYMDNGKTSYLIRTHEGDKKCKHMDGLNSENIPKVIF